MIVTTYSEGDIYKIVSNPSEHLMMRYIREDVFMLGEAYTGIHNSCVIACGGIWNMWENLYETWFALDISVKDNFGLMYKVLKVVKERLDDSRYKGSRIQAYVNTLLPNHENFMKFLKFEEEARLIRYFPNGADGILYRRFN